VFCEIILIIIIAFNRVNTPKLIMCMILKENHIIMKNQIEPDTQIFPIFIRIFIIVYIQGNQREKFKFTVRQEPDKIHQVQL
jgi:hypothetical protein